MIDLGPLQNSGAPILITGASGLVGSSLAELLRQHVPATELLTPSRRELDLEEHGAVQDYLQYHRPAVVFHLAAFVRGLGGNLSAGSKAFETNIAINHNVLSACVLAPPALLFAAGTVAMYPHPYHALPLLEEHVFLGEPHASEYLYAVAKRAMFPYLQALQRAHGVRVCLGLFTNLYGPRDRLDAGWHVVPSLVGRFVDAQRAGKEDVVVWGEPETTRDFLYVRDAATAVMRLSFAGVDVCNISSGREVTMGELVDVLTTVTGFTGTVHWDSSMPVGIRRRWVDNSRLTEAIPDFLPCDLKKGLAETVRWYREQGRS
ncbi:MAG: NAD-dependent epimerase/dehydratase family protein [Actinomycetia bacterium]|nr:NAD-dependent epimerase/dehydratase family protein [Actinomycetes bacterium]